MATIFKGDWGTIFHITVLETNEAEQNVVMNISTATTKQILFTKPSGTLLTKTAVFTTDGTNGQIQYVSIDGDLNEAGTWTWQGLLTFASGKWHTTTGSFSVSAALD